jgi:hypothetical protein
MRKIIFLLGISAIFLMLMIWSCETPDQPMYDSKHPDPNPTGGTAAVLTSITPAEALPGETVTITGNGFNTNAEYNMVSFGTEVGEIISVTATTMEVILPPLSGQVKVKVAIKGSEFWSNAIDFTFKSFIPEIDNPEIVIVDSTISWPNGVDVDDAGNVYIGSANDGVIYKIDASGTSTSFAEVPVQGHIHFGPENYLYVCEMNDGKIVRISSDGGTIEDVVELESVVDFDWDANGNMYLVTNEDGLYMMPSGTNSAEELAVDIGSVKNCRVFGGYVYVSKIWDSQITRFEIVEGGVGEEEVYYEADTPSSFDFDVNGTMYWAHAWEVSLFVYAPGGAEEATLYEDELMTPMRYMTFHGQYLYIVYPGWADIGMTMRLFMNVEGAPRYGRM